MSVRSGPACTAKWCLCFVLSFVGMVCPWPGEAGASGRLAPLLRDLAGALDRQVGLAGKDIQVQPEDFAEGESGMRSPFADRLYDELAAALTGKGARISLHEQGLEPLRMVGLYRQDGDDLEISLRLRRMAAGGAVDLGAAAGRMRIDDADRQQLRTSLDVVAAALVKQLEKKYPGGTARVKVEIPAPMAVGQPRLRLGGAFREALEKALAASELFGAGQVLAPDNRVLQLQAAYGQDDPVGLSVKLLAADTRLLAEGAGSMARGELPPLLFEMIQDQDVPVCVAYRPADARAVPGGTAAARAVVEGVTAVLNQVNIRPVDCGRAEEAGGMRIDASLSLEKKTLPDGYGVLSGRLTLDLSEQSQPAGQVLSDARQPFTGTIEQAGEALARKLFTPACAQQLATAVLAYRPALPAAGSEAVQGQNDRQ